MTLNWKRFGLVATALGVAVSLPVCAQAPVKEKKKPAAAHAVSKPAGKSSAAGKTTSKSAAKGSKGGTVASRASGARAGRASRARHVSVHSVATAKSASLTQAFTASANLRPMAQQLNASRSLPAFNGVMAYARAHSGEGASAAYLSIGHAYMLDKRFNDASVAFQMASQQGHALDDYADYLGAQAALQGGRPNEAVLLLNGFAQKYPESVFAGGTPLLLANAQLAQNNAQGALTALRGASATAAAKKPDFQLAMARALQMGGQTAQAIAQYRQIYMNYPLANESVSAQKALDLLGSPLTASERKLHADKLFNAKRYNDAGAEYHSIRQSDSSLSQADRDALDIYMALCDLKQKRLSDRDATRLNATNDDSAALKLYLLAELARNRGDVQEHRNNIQAMLESYPKSRWLEEALYSGGNMYLLKRDTTQAIWHYQQLYTSFPNSTYAPSAHWRVAWLTYRTRSYAEAARLMEEQVVKYPASTEAVAALFWRARLYEDPEKNYAQAASFYQKLSDTYSNYFYAIQARIRLKALGPQPSVTPSFVLASVKDPTPPTLVDELPENDPHLIKARLLANAALNEYIGPEIHASPTSDQWGTLAEAEIYSSFGETWRSLQAMKHSGTSFLSLSLDELPHRYWELLFPRPFWPEIQKWSAEQGLDPYMVAALIRQETEFNPGAVSHANAWGLMQLIPSSGKAEAKRLGIKNFSTQMLLNPSINIELGTSYLKRALDRFGGQAEYVYAAYNAGDTPVRNWMAANDYRDVVEYVESIPYTETREYVQALMRNRELYRQVYAGR